MKVLTKKKAEALFDDIMVLSLIASESARQQTMDEKPDIKDLIRTLRIIVERTANAACTLKGLFGIALAQEIHTKYNECRMMELLKKEVENDTLDNIDYGKENGKGTEHK